MDLVVELGVRGDRATAVYRALLDAVRGGRLEPGARLPATRTLAADLGVSRTTVVTAYDRLVAEGFLRPRVGDGTYVSDAAGPARSSRRVSELAPRPGWTSSPHPVSGSVPTPPHDFRVGIPDVRLFPFDTWRRLVTAELRAGAHDLGTYADPAGHPPLREAIARQLALSRGVSVPAGEVVVTQGTQQALDLVARVLVTAGDVVAVEDPSYPLARDLFASYGARVVPVRVDDEGLVVDELPSGCRLVFTTPSHQFPLGPPLSLDRRRALLDFAARHRVAIVEDDYDSEFRWTERPLETLFSMDASGRVIYLGTFSKSLVPGLRAGYLVAPAPLQEALRAAKQLAVGYGSVPEQAALARFLCDGLFARHLRRARAVYAERRALVVAALHGPLAPHLTLVPCAAGLHVTALLRDQDVDDTAVVARAAEGGIAVEALSTYASTGRPRGIVMGYGAAQTASITPGLRGLTRVLDATTTGVPRRR